MREQLRTERRNNDDSRFCSLMKAMRYEIILIFLFISCHVFTIRRLKTREAFNGIDDRPIHYNQFVKGSRSSIGSVSYNGTDRNINNQDNYSTSKRQLSYNHDISPSTSKTNKNKNNTMIQNHPHYNLSSLISDYITFHKSAIDKRQKDQPTLKNATRYLIYECTRRKRCGGIGDRVLGMIRSFYFAILTKRVLLIDAPFPTPLRGFLMPHLIQWDASFPKTTVVYDDMNAKMMIEDRDDVEGYRLESAAGIDSRLLSDLLGRLLLQQPHDGSMMTNETLLSLPFGEAYYRAFHVLFKFTDDVYHRADEMKIDAGLAMAQNKATPSITLTASSSPKNRAMFRPYIGMHHREGDRDIPGTDPHQYKLRRSVSPHVLEICYRTVRRIHHFPSGGYLASDSARVKMMLREEDDSIHTSEGTMIFHVDKNVRYAASQKKRLRKDEVTRGVLDSWAELVVLIESDCLIMSSSMFSFLAYYVRGGGGRGGGGGKQCNVYVLDCDEASVARKKNVYVYESGGNLPIPF